MQKWHLLSKEMTKTKIIPLKKKRKGKFFKTNGTISEKGMLKLTKSGLSLKANSCKRTV